MKGQLAALVLVAAAGVGESFLVGQPLHHGAVAGKSSSRFSRALAMRDVADAELISEGGGGGGGGAPSSKGDIKSDLLERIDLASSSSKRTEVNELMLKLEPLNPTEAPAYSTNLNGVWEFLYTGGMSPGMLGIQILSKIAKNFSAIVDLKSVVLTIRRDQPRVEAAVTASLLGRQGTLRVRTRLIAESDVRLSETYEEAEIAGMTIPIPSALQLKRTLFITYLDDDLVVARDNSGSPDLLVRKEKEFPTNDGVPSYTDADLSPGSG